MAMVIRVRFKRAAKLYDFDPNGLELHNGMSVVTETARGVELGECILHAYDVGNPLPARSFVELYYRLAYPVKFWKIVNFYYNARKVWTPDKNIEKLNILMEQEQQKQNFLDKVFRDVAHLR